MRSPDFFRGIERGGRIAAVSLLGVGVGIGAKDAFSASHPPSYDQRAGIVQSGSLPTFDDPRFRIESFSPSPVEQFLDRTQVFTELAVSEEHLRQYPEQLARVRAFGVENGDTDEIMTIAGFDSTSDIPGTMKRSRFHSELGFTPFEQAFHQAAFRPLDVVRDSDTYYVSGIQAKKPELSLDPGETRPVFASAKRGEHTLQEIPLPDTLRANLADGLLHNMVPIPDTSFIYLNIEYSYKGTQTPTIEMKQALFHRETQKFVPIESDGKGKRRQHMTFLEQRGNTAVFVGMEEYMVSNERSVIEVQINLDNGHETRVDRGIVADNVYGFKPFVTKEGKKAVAFTTGGFFGVADLEAQKTTCYNANQWVNSQENTITNSSFLGSIQVLKGESLVAIGSFAQDEPYARKLLVAKAPLAANGELFYQSGIAHPRPNLITTRQEGTQIARIGTQESVIGTMDGLGLQVTSANGEIQYLSTDGQQREPAKTSANTIFLPGIARNG